MSTTEANRFVSPYDDPAPEGAEGWAELYPYYLRFREDRREFEESRFWFADLQSSSRSSASVSTTPVIC
jgi:pyruvate,water dikinase